MKVLICHRPGGAFGYISDGWVNAFTSSGITCQRWDGDQRTWDQFAPDLYIGCSGHRQPIPKNRGNTKIAIHVNPYGAKSVPGIDENRTAIDWVSSHKPNAVFGYGFAHHSPYWSKWDALWVPMPTAGDAVIYHCLLGTQRDIKLGYLGGCWAYKAKTINAYLLPLTKDEPKLTIFGWGDWPPELKVTGLLDNDVVNFFNRCMVVPCISELHTQEYGIDLPERVFKVILCGALPVHDPVVGLNQNVLRSLPVAKNTDDYWSLCRLWCRPEMEAVRQTLVKQLYDEVVSQHTYHHRLHHLMTILGFTGAAKALLSGLSTVLKK